jgi:Amt family ammonium transporter
VLIQLIAVLSVFVYSAVGTVVILKAIQLVTALRPASDLERRGMDVISHGEEGYATGDGAVIILDEELNGTPASAPTPAVAGGRA